MTWTNEQQRVGLPALVQRAIGWSLPFQISVLTDGTVFKTYENGKSEQQEKP